MRSLTFFLLAAICLAACTNYGKKAKSGDIEVYYKDGIEKADAEKMAKLFDMAVQRSGPSSGRKSFQLSKAGDTVTLKMVADKEALAKLNDDEMLYSIINLVADSVFNGRPVNLVLTNNKFKGFRTVTYVKKESPEEKYGTKYVSGNVEVYNSDLDNETSQRLAGFLDNDMNPENLVSFQLSRPENGFYTLRMASNPGTVENVTDEAVETLCQKISEGVFQGAPIVFQFTNTSFEPFRTYNYRTKEFQVEASDTTAVGQ